MGWLGYWDGLGEVGGVGLRGFGKGKDGVIGVGVGFMMRGNRVGGRF
jgi:hypothetical protein